MEGLQRKKTGEFASFSYTERGRELAERVSALLTEAGYRCVGAEVEEAFRRCDLLVFVGASGIAVRKIAPYVRDKFQDPAVLCLDEYGRFVIPLLSGHVGGANAFARFLGRKLGAAVVVSTATDLNRRFAVDVFAVQNGLRIGSREKAKRVSAALLRGEEVAFLTDFPLGDTEKLPEGLVAKAPAEGQLCIRISAAPDAEAENCLMLTPPIYCLGVGCRKGTPVEAFRSAAELFLKKQNITKEALFSIASIDLKREETAVLALAEAFAVPAVFFTAEELRAVPGNFESSAFVEKATGVGAVAARAAASCAPIRVAGKTVVDGATFALYRRDFTPVFAESEDTVGFLFLAGARYQGKRAFAASLQREGRISAYREVPKQWIDCLTAAALREDNALFTAELKRAVTALAAEARSRREALLLDSIGGGLVPITRRERALRDAVGRLQCALAAAADEVYLLELGIARPLKKFGESVEKL